MPCVFTFLFIIITKGNGAAVGKTGGGDKWRKWKHHRRRRRVPYPTGAGSCFCFWDKGGQRVCLTKAVEADADQGVEPAVVLPQATAVVSLPTFILSKSKNNNPKEK